MDKNQNKKAILFMPLCVAAGFAIGTSIGVVVDNIPLGICLGMVFPRGVSFRLE